MRRLVVESRYIPIRIRKQLGLNAPHNNAYLMKLSCGHHVIRGVDGASVICRLCPKRCRKGIGCILEEGHEGRHVKRSGVYDYTP